MYLKDIEKSVKEVIAELLDNSDDGTGARHSSCGVAAGAYDLDASFLELGINSLLAVELVEALNQELGIELGVEVIFDYKDIKELTQCIFEQYGREYVSKELPHIEDDIRLSEEDTIGSVNKTHGPAVEAESSANHEVRRGAEGEASSPACPTRTEALKPLPERRSSDVAIVGISGRFADSPNIKTFWQHLQAGECCIEEIRRKGWETSGYYDPNPEHMNTSISKWGGLLEDIDKFDPLFFNISPLEAARMDPQQRIFLEEAYKASEDAGYSAEELSEKKVGVFVGARPSDYKEQFLRRDTDRGESRGQAPTLHSLRPLSALSEEIDSHLFLGNDMAILAARISYFLNCKGPSLTIDTACSSSLVAIHLACESIHTGESEMALAGGVFVLSSPEFYVMTSKTQMLSPDGKCKTFDDMANGIVIGEGVGAVILKPLEVALADGDHIYGVIKGSGLNQDGRTKGITAPSMLSQKALLSTVYEKAAIHPETLSYIEAHGTGTKLGDPIEIKALTEAFRLFTDKTQFCAIGSHKPNFGHTIIAAGIASVFKILMAMKYKQIPPTINLEEVNRHIGLQGSPFFINTELREWKTSDGSPRRAGVSSFGFSGTNCHVILEEPPLPLHKKQAHEHTSPYYFFPLSAKTSVALRQKVVDLVKWLEEEGENYAVEDLSYTLIQGRSHFSVRSAVVARDTNELKHALREVLSKGGSEPEEISEESHASLTEPLLREYGHWLLKELLENTSFPEEEYKQKLAALADLYAQGYNLDWGKFFKKGRYHRLPLPTYPFSRESYWIAETAAYGVSPREQSQSLLKSAAVTCDPVPQVHPLVQCNTSTLWEQRFSSTFRGDEFFLADHVIKGQRVMPGVTYLEMARVAIALACGRGPVELGIAPESNLQAPQVQAIDAEASHELGYLRLSNVVWARPLVVGLHPVTVHIGLEARENGTIAFVISREEGQAQGTVPTSTPTPMVLSQGTAELCVRDAVRLSASQSLDLPAVLARCDHQIAGSECYRHYRSLGINYGPALQGIEHLSLGEGEVLARLRLPTVIAQTYTEGDYRDADGGKPRPYGPRLHPYVLHPSMLDAAFQACFELLMELHEHQEPQTWVPFALEEISIMGEMPAQGWAWVRRRLRNATGAVFDIEVCDDEGHVVTSLRGLSTRMLPAVDALSTGQDAGTPALGASPRATGLRAMAQSLSPKPVIMKQDKPAVTEDSTREELRGKSITYLKGLVGKVLNLPSAKINASEPLINYGLDSLLVIQLTNALNTEMEQISSTLFFEYETIEALAEHFLHTQKEALERLVGVGRSDRKGGLAGGPAQSGQTGEGASPSSTQRHLGLFPLPSIRRSVDGELASPRPLRSLLPTLSSRSSAASNGVASSAGSDIAIIGLTGRYPGAKDVQAFWDLLKAGKSGIREIPASRWDWRRYFRAEKGATDPTWPTMYTRWGGFLEDIECFDAPFFHISPREAEQIDPQERLFLEVSYACIEDAGYTPLGLQEHGPVGVFVGVMNGNYPTGARYWSIANRVSFVLGLQGPSVAIDTACSSSLTALHFAVESLISGTSACAIIGGVNLIVDPVHYVRLSEVGMLSASDQCKSFGEGADGFVDGEGVGAMLLKPLLQAEADGDHIYGVIKGTAINHGGKTNGYTVPNPQAQAGVVEQALRRAGIDPRTISYVEAHGTGTELGDPIEIAGLTRAWASACMPCATDGATTDQLYCAVGSVKSNIGHAESAAGIAGVTKVLLQMRYGQLVPSLHAEVLNPHIDFSVTPFVVQRELSEWKRDRRDKDRGKPCPRRAGISSFGAGGSNAHVILEEYVERRDRTCAWPSPSSSDGEGKVHPAYPVLIVLSARTEERLRELVQQLLSWIQEGGCFGEDLDDLAYTLQVGREAMEERLALQVNSLQELEEKLHRYVEGGQEEEDWYRGQVKRHDTTLSLAADEDGQNLIAAWIRKGKYEKLLQFWVKGLTIDWKLLYTAGAGFASVLPRRMSLPTYPFARERYRVSTEASPTVRRGSSNSAKPMLTENLMEAAIPPLAALHPLVQYNTSTLWEQRFSSTFYGDEFFLADHAVKGQRMMPGVAYLEMARAAIDQAMGSPEQDEGRVLRLSQVVWACPLVVDELPITVHITLTPQEHGTIAFLISRDGANDPRRDRGFARSSDPFPHKKLLSTSASQTLAGSKDPLSLLCQGSAELDSQRVIRGQSLDLPAILSRCQEQISVREYYQCMRSLGISYGPTFQGIEQLSVGEDEALARLRLPAVALGLAQGAQTHTDYVLHPSVLDAALQTCIAFLMEQNADPQPHLPFALEELLITEKVPASGWAWVRRRSADAQTGANSVPTSVFDIEVCDDEGRIAVRLRGLRTRRLIPVGTNLISGAGVVLETGARKGGLAGGPAQSGQTGEGASPSSTQRHGDAEEESQSRGVDDGDLDTSPDWGKPKPPLRVPVKHMDSSAGMLLACSPLWDPVVLRPVAVAPENPAKGIVIIGGTAEEQRAILDIFPHAHVLEIPLGASIESLAECLAGVAGFGLGSIEQVFWLAPSDNLLAPIEESNLSAQQEGVLACFRLIKAFLQLGCGSRTLHWTVITHQTRVLHTSETVHPTHASLLGLFGSLVKEYPHWSIQQVDLPIDASLPIAEMQRLPADPQGHGWLYRNGHWYRQTLVPLNPSTEQQRSAYRRGGVYVIIGGAGGIGEVWSEYLIRRYQAQVIWIGRRRADAEILARQERLAALGPRPEYITADATSHETLQQVYEKIKHRYGRIHGVVHSAIVLLDQSLGKMDEERFQAALAAKVEVAVRLAQVFEHEPLDFVLFFSSLNAFVRAAGQSNYAAGCTFEDAFAARLRQEWSCKVKVMNWGYWGRVGVVASASYQQRMEQMGMGSIEPAEAMQALEGLLSGPVDQMMLFKTTQPVLSGPTPLGELIQTQQTLTIFPQRLPSSLHHGVLTHLSPEGQRALVLTETRQSMQEIEELLCKLLWSHLQSLGLFREKQIIFTDLREQAGISASYERWLEESIALLERQHYLRRDDPRVADRGPACTVEDPTLVECASLWQQWEQHKENWMQNANLKAHVVLVETALRALPAILTGKRPAVEVLFPNGSMHLVEGIYQHHAVADYFNEVLTRLVVAYVQERLTHEEQARIRILEIGAGTGGTTHRVLQSLQPYQACIAEYCYSDISEAFLRHGQRIYAAEHSSLTYRLVNVEKPLAEQGIELGGYDLVIAANVLHATSNIRRTVRNAKAALKKHGLLLLNEITGASLFLHLTFGLLPGWWAYEDAELRTPGGPALSTENWQMVLSDEGFGAISIPTQDLQEAGQQIIVAESDGIIRQEQTLHVGTRTGASVARSDRKGGLGWPQTSEGTSPSSTHLQEMLGERGGDDGDLDTLPDRGQPYPPRLAPGGVTDGMVFDHVQSIILESCAEVLKMQEWNIEEDRSFAEYGVDSIIGINLINVINEKSHLTLPTTVLFDYNTVEQLRQYILREHSATLKALLREHARTREVEGKQQAIPVAQSSNGQKSWRRFAQRREGVGSIGEASSPLQFGIVPIDTPNRRGSQRLQADRGRTGASPIRPLTLRVPTASPISSTSSTSLTTYQRVIVQRPGGIDDLIISEAELPALKDHEVRIVVHAFSLNFADLLCVKGLYPTMPPYPFTPGFEASGVVLAVGRSVTIFQAGDTVMAIAGATLGGQASVMTCPEEHVFHKPDSLSFEEACALPVVAITMIAAFEKARLEPGEKILIQTATGGIGLIAIQLANYYGAQIYATAGSQSKLDYLKQLGVPYRINYQATDFEQEIKRLTAGKGVDVVINTLAGDAIQKGMNCLAPGGRYIEIAMTALKSARTINLSVLSQNQTFYSVDLRKLATKDPTTFKRYGHEMLHLVEEGIITPTIGQVFGWESLKDAYRCLENRQNISKVVVRLPQASPSHMRTSGPRREERLAPAEVPRVRLDHEPIAIIGMSGRFAGSENVSELWEHLAKGTDLVKEVTRWDVADLARTSGETSEPYCKHGSFLEGIDLFDPLFFNISGQEATYMDPQQRLVLEEAWKALEDAGYVGSSIEGRQCGVYIGCAAGDYQDLFDEAEPAQAFWSNAGSVIPARIAYYLNLQGPAIAIDTACSSSLVAMHVACQGLWSGEIEMALAGGVFVQCTPQFYQRANRAGMLSVTGRCSTFDDHADGFVPGEGVGVVVLKRLKDALASGDHIYGVIAGSGMNQDGATRGITAPSVNAQERLLRSVYETFEIEPSQIQMMEAHGTGTKLGDPIEVEALTRVFDQETERGAYCALGSIKSNLGHTATAAGVAGVLKILLALQHKQIPPSLHFEVGNSHIEWKGSPFYVNTRFQDWPEPNEKRRYAAVSSFGFSGTNAHLVIEEAPEHARRHGDSPGYLIVLSARTAEQLRQQVEQLVTFCEQTAEIDCGNMSYTLLLGRKHLKHRLACVVGSTEELVAHLRKWLAKGKVPQISVSDLSTREQRESVSLRRYGNQCIEDCVGTGQARVRAESYLEHLSTIADLYLQGYTLAYERLFRDAEYGRISLPTYPFARESYWVPTPTVGTVPCACPLSRESRTAANIPLLAALHPPVQQNSPDGSEQTRTALLTPAWKEETITSHRGAPTRLPASILVFLCDLPDREASRLQAQMVLDEHTHGLKVTSWSVGKGFTPFRQSRREQRFQDAVVQLIQELQRLLQSQPTESVLVQVVVAHREEPSLLEALASVLKVAQQEHPKLRGQLIEIDEQSEERELLAWLRENQLRTPQELHIRYSCGKRWVREWQELIPVTAPRSQLWKEGGCYLITGGAGGLARLFVQEIAQQVQRAVVILVGRSPLSSEQHAQLERIGKGGIYIDYQQVDVGADGACPHPVPCADPVPATGGPAVQALIQRVLTQYGRLNGIIHAAGVQRNDLLLNKTQVDIQAVLTPKVIGVEQLDEASSQIPLDFFMLCSSLSAVVGGVGLADYAVANAYLDAFAHERAAKVLAGERQGVTVSINWPYWEEGGMQMDASTIHTLQELLGEEPMGTEAGMEAFYQALASGFAQVLVLHGQVERIKQQLLRRSPVLPVEAASVESTSHPDCQLRLDSLRETLLHIVSDLLKVRVEEIDAETELSEYGFDSINFTKLANHLNKTYQLNLTPALFYEYPTLERLIQYLQTTSAAVLAPHFAVASPEAQDLTGVGMGDRKGGLGWPQTGEGASPSSTRQDKDVVYELQGYNEHCEYLGTSPDRDRRDSALRLSDPPRLAPIPTRIAIIGMSALFPQAPDVQSLWRNLLEGKDCIGEIPAWRWDWQTYLDNAAPPNPEQTAIKWAGIIEGVEQFDPLFFGISPREAEQMDPQQRLLMMYVWKAIEDAGYDASSLSGTNTALFVGTASSGYGERLSRAGVTIESYSSTGLAPSVGPNRMSYFLNVHGPSEPIDTACSSSLVATHRGVKAIESGECSLAIVGGVNTLVSPELHISTGKAGMLCEDGRCKTFSAEANGYVRSEGVGMLVLKKLSEAEQDGDHIYGVIVGSAENHGGRGVSLTAPNPRAQADLLITAYGKARIDPRTVGYIEAHGTGTPLGDPIEINGIKTAFSSLITDSNVPTENEQLWCGIGSVKSNMGHTELAAGVAGVIKVLLQMQHKKLVKSLHCERLNPYIELKGSPFYIVQETRPWEAQQDRMGKPLPRRAGVSSFGFGGVNAHVVLEEYVPKSQGTKSGESLPPALIVLSARNEERLHEQVRQLLAWVQMEMGMGIPAEPLGHASVLQDLAYTLQVGREAMEERLAMQVSSLEDLVEKLGRYLQDLQEKGHWYRGQVRQYKEMVALFSTDEELQEAVGKWIQRGKYEKLLEWWAKGLKISWQRLYGEHLPQRISLPTYPFARERYWIPSGASPLATPGATGQNTSSNTMLHPLVQHNNSDFFAQRFSSTFYGEEFFLADHVVKGQRIMPGVAYLEMVRAAVAQAMRSTIQQAGQILRLSQVVWVRPLVIDKPVEVQIALELQENQEVVFTISSQIDDKEDKTPSIISQGRAEVYVEEGVAQSLDLTAIQSRCQHQISARECYQHYHELSIDYGPAFQGIAQLSVGEDEGLARLCLPAVIAQTHADYVLHPSVLDAALQACIGFLMEQNVDSEPHLPFALEELLIMGKVPTQGWAWVRRRSPGVQTEANSVSASVFDIEVCDDEGRIAVRLRGLSTRRLLSREAPSTGQDALTVTPSASLVGSEPRGELLACSPLWDPIVLRPVAVAPRDPAKGIVIIGGTAEEQRAILDIFPRAHVLEIPQGASVESLAERLAGVAGPGLGSIELVFWLAPRDSLLAVTEESILSAQEEGVLACFRLIKAFLQLGYGSKSLGFTVITHQTRTLHTSETTYPTHASLLGLFGALAKEYPHWSIQQADLPVDVPLPVAEMQRLPTDPQGHGWLYRNGSWYRQTLIPLDISSFDTREAYRRGGVYVIIGGAGGIGEVWSEYLIRRYQAQVIWIGRRRADAEIRASQERLAARGPRPDYIMADATNHDSLQHAYAQIKRRYGQIHGVVHSAIVLLDQSLAKMDEERFQAALAAKVEVSVRLAQVFSQESLDFVLFFSALNSFVRAAGQSNYAAGCTFEDAFAARLRQEWSCKVKVMNWGYWGSVGVVAEREYQQRMEQMGVGSIEPAEAMQALDGLLVGPVDQMVLLKMTQPLLPGPAPLGELIQTQQKLTVYTEHLPSYIDSLNDYLPPLLERTRVQAAVSAPLASEIETSREVTFNLESTVQEALKRTVAEVLNVRNDEIESDGALSEYGFDQVALTELTNRLNQTYHLQLRPTLFLEVSTLQELAHYLVQSYPDTLREYFKPVPSAESLRETYSR